MQEGPWVQANYPMPYNLRAWTPSDVKVGQQSQTSMLGICLARLDAKIDQSPSLLLNVSSKVKCIKTSMMDTVRELVAKVAHARGGCL